MPGETFPDSGGPSTPEQIEFDELKILPRMRFFRTKDEDYADGEGAHLPGVADTEQLVTVAQSMTELPVRTVAPVEDMDLYRATKESRMNDPAHMRLAKRAKEGDIDALARICTSALPLIRVAINKVKIGLPKEDLEQIGQIEVIKAVQRYSPERGAELSSYIVNEVAYGLLDLKRNMRKTSVASRHYYGYIKDLALAVRRKELSSIEANAEIAILVDKQKLPPHVASISKDGELTFEGVEDVSLEEITENDEDGSTATPAFLTSSEDIFQSALREVDASILGLYIKKLSPNEQLTLTYLYGLAGNTEHSQAEVADILGVTASRISQIHTKAIKKLSFALGEGRQLNNTT